ncbi:MAG: T9SS type A sorting domain-containing protein, partial [Bacteroidota bacterium]
NRCYLVVFSTIMLVLFYPLLVSAQLTDDYRSTGTGNWNQISSWERFDGSNWAPATTTPNSSNGTITIRASHQITITTLVTADQIVVAAGGTLINQSILTLDNGGVGNNELEISGTYITQTTSGRISKRVLTPDYSPTILVKNGGVYNHARNFTYGILDAGDISVVTWEDGSTCVITEDPGINLDTDTSLRQNFYDLVFNWTSGNSSRFLEANLPNQVRGTFKVMSTGSGGLLVLDNGSGSRTLNVNNFEMAGGVFYVAGSGSSGTQTLNVAGNFLQTGGDFQLCRTNAVGSYNVNIEGNATFSAGTAHIKNNSSSGSTTVAAFTVKGNTVINGGDLNINGDNNGTNQGRLLVRGNLTLSAGVLQHSRASTNGGSGIYFDGNAVAQTFTWSGGTLDTASGGVGKRFYYKTTSGPSGLNEIYSGSTAQGTINGLQGTPASGYAAWPVTGSLIKNIVINNSAGVRMTTRKTVNTQLTLQNGLFQLDSSLRIANGASIQRILGTLSNTPLFTNNVNIIYGDGLTAGSITPAFEMPVSGSNILNNLTINNPGGVLMNAEIAVKGTLTLTAGTITIPPAILLIISSGNAIDGSGFGINKHIITQKNSLTGAQGFLRTGSISSSRLYPIGNGTYYLPATINPSSASDFNLNVFTGATEDGTADGAPFSSKTNIVDAIWTINRTAGASPADITLNWDAALEGAAFAASADDAIGISRHDGNVWDPASGTAASNTLNTVSRIAITDFSPFIVWIIDPLPLKFGRISATRKNKDIRIDWTTYEESMVSHYEIQRSVDGKNFITVGKRDASGNGQIQFDYKWDDLSAPESSVFYRIKSVDEDGKVLYSNIVRVAGLGRNTRGLVIYPNPVNKGVRLNIQLPDVTAGKYQLIITDITGRQIYQETLNLPGGISNLTINEVSNIGKGIYNLSIRGAGLKETKSFIVIE